MPPDFACPRNIKSIWYGPMVAVHELELQRDLAGDSTISTLGKYVLAGCLANCSSDRKARKS